MIAALADPPASPVMSPEQAMAAHTEQARRVADHIWAEAYVAGAGFAASIAPPPPPVVLDLGPDVDQLRAAIATAAADYQQATGTPATVVDLPGWVWDAHGANRVFAMARALGLRARRQPDQRPGMGQLTHCGP